MAQPADEAPRPVGVIWMLDLDEPVPGIAADIPVTFRRAGPESTRTLGTALGGDTSAEVRLRFETGRHCYAAWVAGDLAAYGWVSFDEEFIGELGLRLKLLPGEAYIWDCVTLPAFRQNHLYSALLGYMLHELRAEPFCRVWIGADYDNLPSQRGIERAGFHPVADMVIARVLPLRQMWVQGRPGVPESLVMEARRVFLGDRDRVWLDRVRRA